MVWELWISYLDVSVTSRRISPRAHPKGRYDIGPVLRNFLGIPTTRVNASFSYKEVVNKPHVDSACLPPPVENDVKLTSNAQRDEWLP